MNSRAYKLHHVFIISIAVTVMAFSFASAAETLPELRAVAKLDSFEGDVSLKHKGLWGNNPERGMTLFHGDKILTRNGQCKVIFNDGSVLNVLPNSSIRISEFTEEVSFKSKGVFSSTKNERREIRVLLGKVAYRSGSDNAVETKMISPAAVAALRGTELEFGTNGDTAFINQISGSARKEGNISEGSVPDITVAQANSNKEFAASAEADRLRREYLDAVKALLQSYRIDSDNVYLASVDDLLNLIIIAQAGSKSMKLRADKVLELAAQYCFADIIAMILENESLLLNPDPLVRNRAVLSLEKCRAGLLEAQKAVTSARDMSNKVDELIQRIMTAKSPDEISSIRNEFQASLAEMKSIQTAFNQQALGKSLVGNDFTSGIDQNRFIEDFETKLAETAVDILQSADYDRITVDIIIKYSEDGQPTISVIKTETEDALTGPATESGKTETVQDRDGDGYSEAQGDCDDNDPGRSPGLPEICNDGIDNNCNGLIDEQPCYYGQ